MRIGFDARWYNDSGVGTYVAGLLGALAEHIGDLEIIAYENPENPVPDLQHLPLRRIPLQSPKYSVSSQLELTRRCQRDKLDVFHSPFYAMPLAVRCPVVVNIHDVIPFLFRIYPGPKQWLVKMGYRAAAFRAAHIVTGSHSSARDLQRVLRIRDEQVSVVHDAVSDLYFHLNPRPGELEYLRRAYGVEPPYVLTACPRNWRTKNFSTALQVLALAEKQAASRFQIVVFGSGTGTDIWRQDRSHHPHLDLLQIGFVPANDLGKLLRHAQAFLLTSLYEGFGLPLLEAMSCGCPVVTSNGGSLAEVAGDGAQVFEPYDAHGMSKALASLLNDAEQRRYWSARACTRASEFSWQQTAAQTSDVYRRVCGFNINREAKSTYRHDAQSTHR